MDSVEHRRRELIVKVRATLVQAGVPPHGCAKALSIVLDIAIAQAYRKLSGASVFTLPQIEAIEAAYGVELLTVPQEDESIPIRSARSWTSATFVIGGHELPCEVALGGARKALGQRFAAFILKGRWFIYLTEEYYGQEPVFDVTAMHMATVL